MAISISAQYNGGLLSDIILLTQCYYHHGGTRLNTMKRFCLCSPSMTIPPTKRFDIFPPDQTGVLFIIYTEVQFCVVLYTFL